MNRDVVTIGESMYLLVPGETGLLRHARSYHAYIAGAESNVAIGLARLGHSVGWISRIGFDEFGMAVLEFVRGAGVDTTAVKFDTTAQTGIYFKERRSNSRTKIHYYRQDSAASRMSPQDIDVDYITNARYLHMTGITPALSSSCLEMTRKALQVAKQVNTKISFDINYRQKLWSPETATPILRELVSYADIVFTSLDEAILLSGLTDPEDAANSFIGLGPSLVIVKMGERGAMLVSERGELVHEISNPVQSIDSIGAGDAFDVGFIAGQLRGWNHSRSIRLGNLLGGIATTTLGDVEGLPTWEEVQYLLNGNIPDR